MIEDALSSPAGPYLGAAAAVGVAALLLALLLRLFRRRPAPVAERALTEDLGSYPPPPPLPEGARPLECHGIPCRVRLIVVAPQGLDTGGISMDDVLPILDAAIPGLSALAQRDVPRVRLWDTQLSTQGFTASFRRHAQLPNPEATVKDWLQVCGKVIRHGRAYALGLALKTEREHTLGPQVLEKPHQWMEILRAG